MTKINATTVAALGITLAIAAARGEKDAVDLVLLEIAADVEILGLDPDLLAIAVAETLAKDALLVEAVVIAEIDATVAVTAVAIALLNVAVMKKGSVHP